MKLQEQYVHIKQGELKRLYQQILDCQQLIQELKQQNIQLLEDKMQDYKLQDYKKSGLA